MSVRNAAPYASIIVPTHDRASTLATTIASIQQQTVRDIEIVIVGDGVTPEVRGIAAALAANDKRITFHDWPKAPARGGSHRDRAVREARAARIFYSDDDDFFLPNHVECLGPVLNDCDCVDSSAASITLSGSIQAAMTNHRRGPIREALAGGGLKALFDTHFAHRKAAYEEIGSLWTDIDQGIAAKFLQGFARAQPVTWRTVPRITALSFHGTARQDMSAADRTAEHKQWAKALLENRNLASPEAAYYDWYAFLLANALRLPDESMEAFFERCRIGIDASQSTADVVYALSPGQQQSVRNVFALLSGTKIDRDELAPLVIRLADPMLGIRPRHILLARLLTGSVGIEVGIDALSAHDPTDPYSRELREYLLVRLLINAGRLDDAGTRVEIVLAAPSYRQAIAHSLAADLARRRNDGETALRHATQSRQLDPHLPEAHEPMVWALAKLARFDEAQQAVATANQAVADDRFIQRLKALATPPGA
jgi:glycosyltransferase involved in cell wall biosynthesis